MLACDVDGIDQNLIGWNDPSRSYDYHNLIFDVPWPGMKRSKRILTNTRNTTSIAEQGDYESKVRKGVRQSEQFKDGTSDDSDGDFIFSIVKHWPPEWAKTVTGEK